MMIKKVEKWLNPDMVEYLNDYFTYDYPHYFGQRSVEGSKEFYISELRIDDALNRYLFHKLQKTLNKQLRLIRMYINVQHEGMVSDFHADDGDLTCLYMLSGTLKDSGAFEIMDEAHFPFVQNTLVCFDAKKLHKGHAPIDADKPRITLAFKTEIINDESY
tara:strand:- start:1707 stop:2189 length:483 start_codon:yes stop_codon:yes gene_type:complete